MQLRRPNPPLGASDEWTDRSPVAPDDSEVYQAEPHPLTALPVRIEGPVQTQAMPTVASGSRNVTINAAGTSVLVGTNDPRRASLTIITNQPTYISTTPAQTDQGTAALIPANIGVVLTHRQNVYVSGPATNTYPMTVAVLQESWAY